MIRALLVAAVTSFAISAPAFAQDAPLSDVDAATLIEKLKPKPDAGMAGDSMELGAAAPSNELGAFRVDVEPAVDLAVNFEYNSAELTPDARTMLGVVAEALNSEDLKPYRFRVAGHTDAAGSRGYNQRLSMARAVSVKSYLVEALGIDGSRLETEGYGESRLLLPNAPRDGRNRRVEVTTLN